MATIDKQRDKILDLEFSLCPQVAGSCDSLATWVQPGMNSCIWKNKVTLTLLCCVPTLTEDDHPMHQLNLNYLERWVIIITHI